jgi:exodeoxyribonuclease V gamma subunit
MARTMQVHTSERADVLVDALGALLASDPPGDPFAPEVVAVPTRGVERWVAQRLSHRLGALGGPDAAGGAGEAGVCANVDFSAPARLVHRAVAAASGIDPDDDPWQPERLAWHVIAAVDAAIDAGEPWAAPLARYLVDEPGTSDARDGVRASRRFRFAQQVAGRFAAYASQRPGLVVSWAQGRDDDGRGTPLPDDLLWQATLWRRVRADLDVPDPGERLAAAGSALRDDPSLVDLPARLSVFGPTRLPDAHLTVLAALAAHRDVHLWLPYPSPVLWRRAQEHAATSASVRTPTDPPRRRDAPTLPAHPLLGSMARDQAELALRLTADGATVTHHPAPAPPPTMLGALQRALRDDARPAPDARHAAAPDDRSLQVHACHGRSRQVEVLREVILGLLADDPTLEPRDVVVLCPDVEAFAPLVVAAFGAAATPGEPDDAGGPPPHPGRTLRVRIADRSPARTNPLLRVVGALLDLAGSRVTASAVVDLAGLDAVRRRFRFDDAYLERLRAWTLESGVRWGEDAHRRARYDLQSVGQGTWRAATDRLLLGVAMAEEDYRFLGATLPLDDVGSTDVDLAGRFAELVDRLTGLLAELDGSRPAGAWFDALDRALVLLADTAPADQWQQVEARRVLADARVSSAAGRASAAAALRLADVRALLAPRLAGRPTRTGFRTGALTVCSLEPMRAVPHRVVCLLGMDDGAFPRAGGPSGDDVLARDPLVGERDRRAEDRQLFLDAVTAATDHLVVVHSGADERTGRARPAAVPVGELLDAVDECVALPGGAARALVVHHPLQTVDERNFVAGALGRPGPFSFDDLDRRAALVGREPRAGRRPLLEAPLPPAGGAPGQVHGGVGAFASTVDLDDLVATLEHPARAFVRGRLGVSLPRDVEDLEDRLPLALDPLDAWAIGDRLLAAAVDGVDLDVATAAERRRGRVPPGALGARTLDEIRARVEAVAGASGEFLGPAATVVDVTVALPNGRGLVGSVPGVRGGVVVRAVYSRLGAKHRLRAWVQLLALTAAGAGVRAAVTVGRGQGTRPTAAMRVLAAPSPAEAVALLAELVALFDAARREPLPVPVDLAEAYAQRRVSGTDDPDVVLHDVERAFEDRRKSFGDDDYQVLAWGEGYRLRDIAGTGETGETEPTRFGALALAVWDPLLAHETTHVQGAQ